jgi:hypothetical protein
MGLCLGGGLERAYLRNNRGPPKLIFPKRGMKLASRQLGSRMEAQQMTKDFVAIGAGVLVVGLGVWSLWVTRRMRACGDPGGTHSRR